MGLIIGRLMTAYALYTLSGAGLLVIYFAGSCWYIAVSFGWIALGVYLVAWWIIAECVIRAIAKWIRKNSIFYSQEAWERRCAKTVADDRHIREEEARPARHGY